MATRLYGSSSPSAQAVDAFFDRFEALFPTFVGRMYAMKVSVLVMCVLFMIGMRQINEDRKANQDHSDVVHRSRWLAFVLVLLAVCVYVQRFLMNLIYSFAMVKANSQHFANVFWLEKYAAAAAKGSSAFL